MELKEKLGIGVILIAIIAAIILIKTEKIYNQYSVNYKYSLKNDTINMQFSIAHNPTYNERDGFFNIGRVIYKNNLKFQSLDSVEYYSNVELEKAKKYISNHYLINENEHLLLVEFQNKEISLK